MAEAPTRSATRGDLRLVFGFGLFFLLSGLFGAVVSWGSYRLEVRIQQQGLRAEARITHKYTTFVADEGREHFLRYAFFTPEGRPVESTTSVSKERWQSLRVGDKLEVLYAGERPGRSFPADRPPASLGMTIFFVAFTALFALLGAVMMIGGVHGLRGYG